MYVSQGSPGSKAKDLEFSSPLVIIIHHFSVIWAVESSWRSVVGSDKKRWVADILLSLDQFISLGDAELNINTDHFWEFLTKPLRSYFFPKSFCFQRPPHLFALLSFLRPHLTCSHCPWPALPSPNETRCSPLCLFGVLISAAHAEKQEGEKE